MSESQTTVRFGVLGTGAIAQVAHLPILTRMRGVEVVAVADTEAAKARTIADRFGVPEAHPSFDRLVADDDVDAIVICTPSDLHEQQAIAALEAGKFVLCEKPLALTAEGAARVLAVDGAKERLMVGMNQRFRPDALALRSFVQGGDLGEIIQVHTGWLNRRAYRDRRTWRGRKAVAGGGAFMDLGVQMLDLALRLLDYPAPERLTAYLHRPEGGEVEDTGVVLLRLLDGRIINLEVTWALVAEKERQYLRVLGAEGSASLSPLRIHREIDGATADVTPAVATGRENAFTASYRQQLAYFADLARGNADPPQIASQVRLLQIVEAVYRSAESRQEVWLRD